MAEFVKDTPGLISVASRVHTSVQIVEPPENLDKPGLMPTGQSLVLHGASHPDARNGEMVTHNVDAGIFRRWYEHQQTYNPSLAGLVREVPSDHQAADPAFGFEPGLAALTATEGGQGSGRTVVTR